MQFDFGVVLVFVLLSVAFIFGNLLLGWLARPNRPGEEKNAIYECGEPPIGAAWIRYNIRFYTIALVYLIFDVEVVFLVPVLLVLRELSWLAVAEVLTFVGILTIGLAYAWRYGNLDWIADATETSAQEGEQSEIQELSVGV